MSRSTLTRLRIEEIEPGIVALRLDDAEGQNRLGEVMCRELLEAFDALKRDRSLKVLLLAGRRDVFCAGAALEGLDQLLAGEIEVIELKLPELILGFPVPVIAVLEGNAVGGGLTLALCCDVLVAAEKSRYGVNFTSMGFTPGMATTTLLPALVGHHFAMEMMLCTKFYRGAELRGRGLFNHVVPAGEVEPLALELAQRMAEKPRHVLELVKATLALPRVHAYHEGSSREHLMHRICFNHPDIQQLVTDGYIKPSSAGAAEASTGQRHGQE